MFVGFLTLKLIHYRHTPLLHPVFSSTYGNKTLYPFITKVNLQSLYFNQYLEKKHTCLLIFDI
jgi:hypothetical protein